MCVQLVWVVKHVCQFKKIKTVKHAWRFGLPFLCMLFLYYALLTTPANICFWQYRFRFVSEKKMKTETILGSSDRFQQFSSLLRGIR
jgi:hypothetical protein